MPSNSDIIFIENLHIVTTIGITRWEQQIKQTLIMNLELATDISKSAHSDNIADTVDYYHVAKRIQRFATEHSYQLLEPFAENIASLIMNEFSVPWIRLKISKASMVTHAAHVGIQIERGQRL